MKQKKPPAIGKRTIIVLLVLLLVGIIFGFVVPIASDAGRYQKLVQPDKGFCPVGWFGPPSYKYPPGTKFHFLKGEADEYAEAVAELERVARGRDGCYSVDVTELVTNKPIYRLYL